MKEKDDPCSCGAPWRDYDNRCLRCKRDIDPVRAIKLAYHRKISDIPECQCSNTSKENWDHRETSTPGLFYCNFCNNRLPGVFEELDALNKKKQDDLQDQSAKEAEKKIKAEVAHIVNQAKSGTTVYLYRSRYISIDSYNTFGSDVSQLAPFNDLEVTIAGLQGWKVIEAIPRTAGNTLENFVGLGKAWAGGIGGSVVGAYVLMEYQVNAKNADSSTELIRETVTSYLK